jgi:hypothetical protein
MQPLRCGRISADLVKKSPNSRRQIRSCVFWTRNLILTIALSEIYLHFTLILDLYAIHTIVYPRHFFVDEFTFEVGVILPR